VKVPLPDPLTIKKLDFSDKSSLKVLEKIVTFKRITMLHKLKNFVALSNEDKALFVEAFITLGIMRMGLLIFSFKRLTKSFKYHQGDTENKYLEYAKEKEAKKIGKLITKAANHTP
jgi:hypothetical protein